MAITGTITLFDRDGNDLGAYPFTSKFWILGAVAEDAVQQLEDWKDSEGNPHLDLTDVYYFVVDSIRGKKLIIY